MNERYRKEVRLAQAAFHAALAERWESAVRYLKRISAECGGDGVMTALIAWCDTYVDHATGGEVVVAQRVSVELVNAATGRLGGEVPNKHRWAARLIQARAAKDHEAWIAAIDDLPEDALEMGNYIYAVLQGVARTINGLPRGFARMGRRL